MRLIDVRHEQSAVFAAEATARLARSPGLAVLTAGPGVTNGVSAITTAYFNGSPVVILGGRAPDYRWGSGSLQEFDHPELLRPITKRAWTEHETAKIGAGVAEAFRLAATPHRGPVFVDVALEALFGPAGPDAGDTARDAAPAGPGSGDPAGHGADRRPAGRGPAPGAGARLRCLGGPRRAGRPDRGRGTPAAGDRQRAGPRHPAARPRTAGHPGPGGRVPPGGPGRGGGHRAGLPARLRHLRRGRTAPSRPPSSTSWTPRISSPRTPRWPPRTPATWPRSSTA